MRLADIVTAFPFFILVIALVFVLGNGAWSIFVAITCVCETNVFHFGADFND